MVPWHTVSAQLMLVIIILVVQALALSLPFLKWRKQGNLGMPLGTVLYTWKLLRM